MFPRELRELSFVPRWSIARRIRDQNVAEHSFYTTVYALGICQHFSLSPETERRVIRYALCHDFEEIFTGDIPGPAKRAIAHEHGYANVIVPHVKKVLGPIFWHKDEVPQVVASIVKIASLIDEIFYMATEFQLGNMSFNTVFMNSMARLTRAVDQLEGDPNITAEKKALLNSILDENIKMHRHADSEMLMG